MKAITEYGFTDKQLSAIYDYLTALEPHRNEFSASDTRVKGIQFFIDPSGNFYSSYFMTTPERDSVEFIKIDRDGIKTDLSTVYDHKPDIADRFSRYDEIILS